MTPKEIEAISFCTMPYECAYIDGNLCQMEYKYIKNDAKSFVNQSIPRGWRRFGKYHFYPICQACNECKNLRIKVEDFKMSKSQRKAFNRNKDTQIRVQQPTLTNEHLALYDKYHTFKHHQDGWKAPNITPQEYYDNFVDGHGDFGYEVLYFRDEKLICVDLIDIIDDGISAIYCYYDPDYSRYSLGTFSMLYQINLARELKLKYIYLGYWVEGCKAFAYKQNFTPLEMLDGFPNFKNNPLWEQLQK